MGGGGKGGGAPPPPDYTPIANSSLEAAKVQAQTSANQLQWAKDQFAQTNPATQKYLQSMTDVQNQDIANQKTQSANAAKDRARYEGTYQPIEDKFNTQATGWNSADRQNQRAGAAEADVSTAFDAQRRSALSNLESYGIDPSQTRFGALDLGTRVSQAAATAASGTQSRLNTEATGLSLESEAINIGRGYPGQVAQSYAGATGAGAGATGAGSAAIGGSDSRVSTYGNLMGPAAQWSGLQNSSFGAATGALNAGYNNALGGYNAQNSANANYMSGIGSLIGGAASIGAIAI